MNICETIVVWNAIALGGSGLAWLTAVLVYALIFSLKGKPGALEEAVWRCSDGMPCVLERIVIMWALVLGWVGAFSVGMSLILLLIECI